ncbi:hypothetical protein [Flavisericum labens]|uniref:hypothetical protein n=1 Tax=Flavisericum labens TaxID=3377112 RepID=UPI00387AA7FB
MKKIVFIIVFWGLTLFGVSYSHAQRKNICISDDLSAHSEILKVKLGVKWNNRTWKFKFGDYKIAKSKTGWFTTTTKSNLLNTRTESRSKYKFSFLLNDKTKDTAIVNALNTTSIKALHSFQLFENFYIGDDELIQQADFFSSFITLSSNREETWELLIANTYSKDEESEKIAFLKNGERIIEIIPVSSKDCQKDKRLFPALGYEFIENEQSLCALQYFGGGIVGYKKNIIWMRSDLKPKMKLILAAAMTAIMEIRGPGYIEQLLFGNNTD